MDMKMIWCFCILLISLLHSISGVQDVVCDSCLEASRKAEKDLNNMRVLGEISALSGQVCQALPVNLELLCLKTSRSYMHNTRLLLQEFFNEASLCNNTGLCLDEAKTPANNGVFAELLNYMKPVEDRFCATCRRAIREALWKLREPGMKTKVTNALLDYCEEAEENEEQCKQAVHRYASMVLYKIDHVKPHDLCMVLGFCEDEAQKPSE